MRKMKKTILSIVASAAIAITFNACNEQVPQGTVGKILGKTGFQPEVYPPSKVWVDNGPFVLNPEKLILVETTTQKFVEPIKVLLQDKLELKAAVIFRGRITSNKKRLNSVFNDIKLNDNIITTEEVYNVYGKMIILNTAREIISKYNVDEVNVNYARITAEIYKTLEPKLVDLPIDISDITIGQIEYPEIVTKAIEKAKKRRMMIEEEKANVQIALTRKKGQEELAKANYKIKMLEAKRIRDYNAMTAKGITKDLIELRKLELKEKELDKWDGKLPTTLMGGEVPVIINSKK